MALAIGVLLPLLGTTLGAAMVFFLKKDIGDNLQKALLGFASGVMIAASVWSLLIPAMDMAEAAGKPAWIPAVLGFLLGIAFLLLLDTLTPHLHLNAEEPEGRPCKICKSTMTILAITIHNIPEGMAVGVVLAGMLSGGSGITVPAALALSIGIAMQNLPEGAIISMPLKSNGVSSHKAFGYGAMSGAIEPVGAIVTILLANWILPLLPYMLAFAAGAMPYVVVEELIPEMSEGEHSNIGTLFFAVGFTLMMMLDVALG